MVAVTNHRFVTGTLLDGAVDGRGVLCDRRPLVGVLGEQPDCQSHRMGGVVDRRAQELGEQRPDVGVVEPTVVDGAEERARDVVTRRPALLRDQLVGEASQLADRFDHVVHHRRIAGERLERDARPVGELGATGDVAADHPAEHGGRDAGRDVGHELTPIVSGNRVEQLTDERDGLGAQGLDATGREPRHHDPTQILVVASLGPQQRPPDRGNGAVRRGAANHLEHAGPERGIEDDRVAARVGQHTDPRWRTDDRGFLACGPQGSVRIGRERVRAVVEERERTDGRGHRCSVPTPS